MPWHGRERTPLPSSIFDYKHGFIFLRKEDSDFRYQAAHDCGGRGPMQIHLREGAVLRWAETVLQGATHDPACPENWLGERISPRLWLKRAQVCLAARQVSGRRAEACRVFALERVLHAAAVTFGGEQGWSSAAREPFDDFHRSANSLKVA